MSTWGSRERNERGAAVVETALCLCFVVLPLVFATVSYAYMLSFRQTMTQAAAEGARAGAVAPSGTSTANQTSAAIKATTGAMGSGPGGLTCNSGNLVCTAPVAACTDGSGKTCITVTVTYPYRDNSLLPTVPGLGFLLPKSISYSAVAEVN